MIEEYKSSIISAISGLDPDVILTIEDKVFFLSPGLILSGLYPQ